MRVSASKLDLFSNNTLTTHKYIFQLNIYRPTGGTAKTQPTDWVWHSTWHCHVANCNRQWQVAYNSIQNSIQQHTTNSRHTLDSNTQSRQQHQPPSTLQQPGHIIHEWKERTNYRLWLTRMWICDWIMRPCGHWEISWMWKSSQFGNLLIATYHKTLAEAEDVDESEPEDLSQRTSRRMNPRQTSRRTKLRPSQRMMVSLKSLWRTTHQRPPNPLHSIASPFSWVASLSLIRRLMKMQLLLQVTRMKSTNLSHFCSTLSQVQEPSSF